MNAHKIIYLVVLINMISLPGFCQDIQWTRKSEMPEPVSKSKAAFVNGKMYIIGGISPQSKGFSTSNFEYDIKSDSWTRKKDIPSGRINYASAVVLGKIYVIGGDPFLNRVDVYDPVFDKWDVVKKMPTGRQHVSCAAVNDKIFVIGGLENVCCPPFPERCDWEQCTKISDKNEVYDPLTDSWKSSRSMPTPRHGAAVISVNSKIYAVGGMGNKSSMWAPLNTVEEYDPIEDTWTKKKDMPSPRDGFGYTVQNDKIYIFGGWVTDKEQTNTTIVYDTKLDIWTFSDDIPIKTGACAYSTYGNRIYFFGGDKEDYTEIYSFVYEGAINKR